VIDFYSRGIQSTTYSSHTPIPELLHANRESRDIGRKHYQLSFACTKDRLYDGRETIWTNFHLDTFYFGPTEVPSAWLSNTVYNISHMHNFAEHPKIKWNLTRIALHIKHIPDSNTRFYVVTTLSELPKLAELVLVGDEISSSFLEGYRGLLPSDSNQTYLMDPGDMAETSWARDADRLREAFDKYRAEHFRQMRVPKVTISVKLLVKDKASANLF
jgi:hypothetical protein